MSTVYLYRLVIIAHKNGSIFVAKRLRGGTFINLSGEPISPSDIFAWEYKYPDEGLEPPKETREKNAPHILVKNPPLTKKRIMVFPPKKGGAS